MATTTNYGWTTPDDTDLVKDGAAAIRTLGSSADTTVFNLSPGTTAGDLDYYTSGTAKARIGIGTVGQVLTVNAGATAPEWATPAGGGGITLLSTTSLSGSSTTISSISGAYKDLYVRVYGVQYSTGASPFTFSQNGSFLSYQQTGTTYNSSTSAYLTNNAGSGKISGLNLYRAGGENWFSLYFPNYSSTSNKRRSFQVFGGMESDPSESAVQSAGVYRTNPAVALTSLTFNAPAGTFSAGTVLIYGAN